MKVVLEIWNQLFETWEIYSIKKVDSLKTFFRQVQEKKQSRDLMLEIVFNNITRIKKMPQI
jgi:hypothetical protein